MFDVPAHDDPRILVTIPVPVKGRKPLALKVPRFDFIDESQHDEIQEAIAAIDDDLVPRKRARLGVLLMLKPFLSAADYKACEGLTVGQLQVVRERWTEQSSIPLGELLASADSSTENTGAPSSSTSTPVDGLEGTSDAA